MAKYQYLQISFATRDAPKYPARIHIEATTSDVDLQWLWPRFPPSKIELKSDREGKSHNILIDSDSPKVITVYYDIIEYCGSEGWEPFAIGDRKIHLRRSQ